MMKKLLSIDRLLRGTLVAVMILLGVGAIQAASFDSTELIRQRVRIQDKRLQDMLQGMPDDADFSYRQVVIRKMSPDVGGELKDSLFRALRSFLIDRKGYAKKDVENTTNIDSVRIMAAVSGDSIDVFYIKFFSQRDSSYTQPEQDRKTGELVQRTRTAHLIKNYDLIGRTCYDANRELFTEGVYKGISVGDVLTQEFLSPLNSEIVDVYGSFGNYGDKIVLDPEQRLKFYNLFTSFYTVLPMYDTVNLRDSAITVTVTDNATGTPKQIQKSMPVWDGVVLKKSVQPEFEEPVLDFSLLHQITINPFSDKSFGLQAKLGIDEMGLPFWSSGTGQAYLILRNKIFDQSVFKFGVVFPFGVGETSTSSLFTSRKLAGGWGFAAEGMIPSFNIPAGLNLPLGFSLQYVPPFQKNGTVIDTSPNAPIYYVSFAGTIYFPFIINLNPRRNTSFVQLQVGLGWEDITQGVALYEGFYDPVLTGDTIKKGDPRIGNISTIRFVGVHATPHIRVDYVNHEAAKFGTFLQYDHNWMVGAWIELFNGFRIEMEYSAPLHHADPWESQSFFLISPRIRIL